MHRTKHNRWWCIQFKKQHQLHSTYAENIKYTEIYSLSHYFQHTVTMQRFNYSLSGDRMIMCNFNSEILEAKLSFTITQVWYITSGWKEPQASGIITDYTRWLKFWILVDMYLHRAGSDGGEAGVLTGSYEQEASRPGHGGADVTAELQSGVNLRHKHNEEAYAIEHHHRDVPVWNTHTLSGQSCVWWWRCHWKV